MAFKNISPRSFICMSNLYPIVMRLINSYSRLQGEGNIERLLRILWKEWWNSLIPWRKVSTNGLIICSMTSYSLLFCVEESRVRAHFNAEYGSHLPEDICLCIGNAPTRWEVIPWQDSSPEVLPFIPKDLIIDVRLFILTTSCEWQPIDYCRLEIELDIHPSRLVQRVCEDILTNVWSRRPLFRCSTLSSPSEFGQGLFQARRLRTYAFLIRPQQVVSMIIGLDGAH